MNSKHNNKPQWLYRLTWLTIAVQSVFPVTCALTPAMAAAQQHFLNRSDDINALQTRVYTLAQGETVSDVAKKYHISVDALRQLNQLRTFAHGFERLQAGDELDIPLSPLPKVQWRDAEATDALQLKTAGLAAQAGASLDNRSGNSNAAAAATNIAAGEAGAQAQQWLSQFGTAQVQLDSDKNFSLKNSRFDLLLPLSDRKDRLIFTQGSFHRTDERNQANLGLGMRHFADNFMTGANAFLDYDLSRDHARSGLGVEYWRDFVRLAANGYIRLTSWKDSKDFSGYEERPANGWDIRSEAFLPAWPQLGAKLNYEQYYGNEVALFGTNDRQKNPHAITAGITFTPFPLVTLEAEQRQGKAGENDTRLGLTLNYQIGMPWQKQLDSDAVATLRSLAGNRYDLVNRNNDIILDYRKNEVITLHDARLITGFTGEQKTLNVSVNSKYGLDRIEWSAASLLANGGKIVANGPTDFSVVLPTWHNDASGVNTYTISGVAIDKRGNVSRRTETQVTVAEATINVSNSLLLPANSELPADNHSQQILTLTLKDNQGNPVDIDDKEISVAKSTRDTDDAKITAFTRQRVGVYSLVVTAGTHPETLTITPTARNMTFPSATVTIGADTTTARLASLTVVNDNVVADGKDKDRVTATVTDAQGNPLAGQTVNFSADHSAAIVHSAVTNAKGEAQATITDLKSGESTVTARLGSQQTQSAKVHFVAGKVTQFDLEAVARLSHVDTSAPLNLYVSAKDANGNPVTDRAVTIKANDAHLQLPSSVMLRDGGNAMFRAGSTYAAPFYVTGSIDGHSRTVELDFIPGEEVLSNTSFTAENKNVPADGVSEMKITFTPRDKFNNLLSNSNYANHANDVHFDLSGLPGSKIVRSAYDKGVYIIKLSSTQAGSGTIKAQYKNAKVIKSLDVSFTRAVKR